MRNVEQRRALVRSGREGRIERKRKAELVAREILLRGRVTPAVARQLNSASTDWRYLLELLANPIAALLVSFPTWLRSAVLAYLVSLLAIPFALLGLVVADIVGVSGWPN